jgi:hypothetical protein
VLDIGNARDSTAGQIKCRIEQFSLIRKQVPFPESPGSSPD